MDRSDVATSDCHTPPTRVMRDDGDLLMTRRKPTITYDGYGHLVEHERKKSRNDANKSGTKNRSRRSARRRLAFPDAREGATLRSELSSVHKTYQDIIHDKDEEITILKRNIMRLSHIYANDIDSLEKVRDDLQEDLNITERKLSTSLIGARSWIGCSLKFKFILDEIKKIGALPPDHADWVEPMVEEIRIPVVSINIKDEFVPTIQTDNIDWVDSEEEEYEDQPDDIPDFARSGTVGARIYWNEHPESDIASATMIQAAWRGYHLRLLFGDNWKINMILNPSNSPYIS